jgi:hypothetical protein
MLCLSTAVVASRKFSATALNPNVTILECLGHSSHTIKGDQASHIWPYLERALQVKIWKPDQMPTYLLIIDDDTWINLPKLSNDI